MRLSDLLEHDVVDQNGRRWGQVHDVHLVQDGPLRQSNQATFRLHGLLAGPGSFGTRLGYNTRLGYTSDQATKGPLPIRLLMQWMGRKAIYIPWSAVTAVERDRIVVDDRGDGFSNPFEAGDKPSNAT